MQFVFLSFQQSIMPNVMLGHLKCWQCANLRVGWMYVLYCGECRSCLSTSIYSLCVYMMINMPHNICDVSSIVLYLLLSWCTVKPLWVKWWFALSMTWHMLLAIGIFINMSRFHIWDLWYLPFYSHQISSMPLHALKTGPWSLHLLSQSTTSLIWTHDWDPTQCQWVLFMTFQMSYILYRLKNCFKCQWHYP